MEDSESVKMVMLWDEGAMLRAYSMDSSSAWKLLKDRVDAPAVLYSKLFLKKYSPARCGPGVLSFVLAVCPYGYGMIRQ